MTLVEEIARYLDPGIWQNVERWRELYQFRGGSRYLNAIDQESSRSLSRARGLIGVLRAQGWVPPQEIRASLIDDVAQMLESNGAAERP